MPSRTLDRIAAFDAGRDPVRLARKYSLMRTDAFSFMRGTCRLFYEDLDLKKLPASPLVWCCGDLHLQNFGTYKGDNRLTYFDINDFDECCLAPVGLDLVRFLTSIMVVANSLKMPPATITVLTTAFLDGYTTALTKGKAGWLERATSEGMIRDLLSRLKKRNRKKFLDSRTCLIDGKRQLITDNDKALPLGAGEREMLSAFMEGFAKKQSNPGFFRFLDAARRIAGNGSLGLERFVILVQGRGTAAGNFLLDLKMEAPSSVLLAHPMPQPAWHNEAERVAVTQATVQAVEPALFTPVQMDKRWWLLRELMPTRDGLDISGWQTDIAGLTQAVRSLGEVVAWGNLRSAGRRGADLPDTLIKFGGSTRWATPLLREARKAALRTEAQWTEFVRAQSAGQAKPAAKMKE